MDAITMLVTLLLALATAPTEVVAQARAAQEKSAPPAQDDFFVGRGQAPAEKPVDVAALRREMARARLLLEVDGKPEAARRVLVDVWDALGRGQTFAERREFVLSTLETSVAVFEALGDRSRLAVLFTPPAFDPVRRADLEDLATDARFIALRRRALDGAAAPGADLQRIDALVRVAVSEGVAQTIRELGLVAAPTLEALVRGRPDDLPPVSNDALEHLFTCAPDRAARLSVEILRSRAGGFLFAKRVLRAMGTRFLLADPSAMLDSPPQERDLTPPVLLEPAWRDLVTELLREPLLAPEAFDHAAALVSYDVLDEPLRVALAAYAESANAAAEARAAELLSGHGSRATVRPLLERLLASPRPRLRVAAADALSDDLRNEALLASIDDPEAGVRAAVARMLRPRSLPAIRYVDGSARMDPTAGGQRRFRDEDRPLLDRLLGDSDASVRAAALDTASKASIRLDEPTAARFLADPADSVRAAVLPLLPEDPDAAARLLGRALVDPASHVRGLARARLHARFGVTFENNRYEIVEPTGPYPTSFVDLVVRDAFENGALTPDSQSMWIVVRNLLRTQAGANAFVRAFTAEQRDVRLLSSLTNAIGETTPGSMRGAGGRAEERDERPRGWHALDAPVAEALLRRIHEGLQDSQRFAESWAKPARPAACREAVARIVVDPAISRAFRVRLLGVLRDESNLSAFVVRVLTEPAWDVAEGAEAGDRFEFDTSAEVPSEQLARAVGPLLDADVPAPVVAQVVESSLKDGPGPVARARDVLERVGNLSMRSAGAAQVWAMRTEAEAGRWDAVERVLRDPERRSLMAVGLVGRLRPPGGLDWVAAVLHNPSASANLGAPAASAIAGYLSEEAAEILLRGAELAPNADVRKACLDGVEEIRAFLEQKARWKQRTSAGVQRDAAVADLAAMLDAADPILRAEAARGLATLEAVESIPRLVRLLQDRDEGVRKAARAALDRLNAP